MAGKTGGVFFDTEADRLRREHVSAAARKSARNIGPIPPIEDIDRRLGCENSLMKFGLTYFGKDFWELSPLHKKFLKRLELIIKKGGRTVYVLPRGFGKSVWSRIAVLWAICYGYRKFCPLIAANGTHAENNYLGVKALLETPEFAADFPEISFPIVALEGIAHRCGGQTYQNKDDEVESTNIEYTRNRIVLPSTDGAVDILGQFYPNKARNSAIISQGLFAAVRGLSVVRWDGLALRPDFALCDDPQDEESAESPVQIAKRLRVIRNSLIGSGGHEKPLAIAMAATIIAEDDLVEQLLADPAWTGERVAFFEKLPDTMESMWLSDYKRIRQDYDRNNPDDMYRALQEATDFYKANREQMDMGAVVAWEHCFSKESCEISAIQHGMNALIDQGEEYFNSEVQNKPRREVNAENLVIHDLKNATNKIPEKLVPGWANTLTAAIDVHDDLLFYVVTAWSKETFGGQVIQFGTYPEQKDYYFKQGQVNFKLSTVHNGISKEAAIRKSLDKLTQKLIKEVYRAEDGSDRKIDRILVDSGYQAETVFRCITESDNSRIIFPSRGEYYGAKGQEFNTITRNRRKSGKTDIIHFGIGWRACRLEKYRALQRVFYDSNWWKTFVRERIKSPDGSESNLRFHAYTKAHDLFYDHCLCEKSALVEAKGRRVQEWDNPRRRDNHWWDCLVYATIGASMEGCHIQGTDMEVVKKTGRKRRRIGY